MSTNIENNNGTHINGNTRASEDKYLEEGEIQDKIDKHDKEQNNKPHKEKAKKEKGSKKEKKHKKEKHRHSDKHKRRSRSRSSSRKHRKYDKEDRYYKDKGNHDSYKRSKDYDSKRRDDHKKEGSRTRIDVSVSIGNNKIKGENKEIEQSINLVKDIKEEIKHDPVDYVDPEYEKKVMSELLKHEIIDDERVRKIEEERKRITQEVLQKYAAEIINETLDKIDNTQTQTIEVKHNADEDLKTNHDDAEDFEEDEVDMFAETPGVPIINNHLSTAMYLTGPSDDHEGYYRPSIGELVKNRYQVVSLTGKGVFSNVVKANDLHNNNTVVAIKFIRNNEITRKSGEKESAMIARLNELDPSNKRQIIRMYDRFEYRSHICMVLECMEMNLRETLTKYGKNVGLSLQGVKLYATQLFIALEFLREHKIIHADLKPDNIMVSKDTKHIKLCDFGSAFPVEENGLTDYLVSRFYRAPEIILGCAYDMAIDVWSAGTSLYELFTGKVLFPGKSNNEMLMLMMKVKGKFSKKLLSKGAFVDKHFNTNNQLLTTEIDPVTKLPYTKLVSMPVAPVADIGVLIGAADAGTVEKKDLLNFKDFLEKCLTLDPNKRMKPDEALIHPFIDIKSIKRKDK